RKVAGGDPVGGGQLGQGRHQPCAVSACHSGSGYTASEVSGGSAASGGSLVSGAASASGGSLVSGAASASGGSLVSGVRSGRSGRAIRRGGSRGSVAAATWVTPFASGRCRTAVRPALPSQRHLI